MKKVTLVFCSLLFLLFPMFSGILYLASKSPSRKILLEMAKIPFVVIEQSADEQLCDWNQELGATVLSIAQFKMQHAIIPHGIKIGDICFVLSADTLIEDVYGQKHGKPIDKADAKKKLLLLNQGAKLATGFCLHAFTWDGKNWLLKDKIEKVVFVTYKLIVPEEWMETYFNNTAALGCAGAHFGELFGMQFVQEIHGSYSGALGLPMFELRQALLKLGFLHHKKSEQK